MHIETQNEDCYLTDSLKESYRVNLS